MSVIYKIEIGEIFTVKCISLEQWYSTAFVGVPPDVISQLTPNFVYVYFNFYTVYHLHLK
jgi:hypothetical protein